MNRILEWGELQRYALVFIGLVVNLFFLISINCTNNIDSQTMLC
jgi:hypothetical protein